MKKSYLILVVFSIIITVIGALTGTSGATLGIVALFGYVFCRYHILIPQENLNSIRKVLQNSSISSDVLASRTGVSADKIDYLRISLQYSEKEIGILCKELGIKPKKKFPTLLFIYVGFILISIFLVYFVFSEPA